MAEHPFLPLWTDAYLGDTMHLSLEEHGAYLKLLIIAWRSPECCLPDDDVKLARMLGVTVARWRGKLRPAIEPFWTVAGGRWMQKRLSEEREKARNFSEVQRERSKKRWDAKPLNGHDPGDAGALPRAGKPSPSPSPSPSPKANHEEPLCEPAEPALPDVKSAVWKALVGVLGPSSRPLIGSWFRDYGEDGVILAYSAYRSAALGGEKLDPKSYIAGIMKNAAKKKSNGMGIADKIRAQLAAEGVTLQ